MEIPSTTNNRSNTRANSNSTSYKCRIFKYTYFQYRYGFEPSFLLGTTGMGQDMLTRLAAAAQFSLVFAVCVAAINLDGELRTATEVVFEIAKEKLRFFYPKGLSFAVKDTAKV